MDPDETTPLHHEEMTQQLPFEELQTLLHVLLVILDP